MIEQLTIIGPGLLGASLGMRIKKLDDSIKVSVWGRNKEKLEYCQAQAWCDLASNQLEEVIGENCLVVFCVPVNAIVAMMPEVANLLPESSRVTDVGSTKAKISEAARNSFENGVFIGSHPMAGSHNSGIEFADENLYEDRACIVTDCSDEESVQWMSDFWRWIGMKVVTMQAGEHDSMVAGISHLPHLASSAIVRVTCRAQPFRLAIIFR